MVFAVTLPKFKWHCFLLVNYVENKNTNYKVIRYTDVVDHSSLRTLEGQIHVKLPDKTRPCNVVMTSNDADQLNAVWAHVEAYCNSSPTTIEALLAEYDPDAPSMPSYLEVADSYVPRKAPTCKYPIMSEDGQRNKMYILGENGTTVGERILSRILWNDHASATNDLLDAVFSEQCLATYILARKLRENIQLNPSKLQDIVSIVTDMCRVQRRDVHEAIRRRLHSVSLRCGR